MSAAGLVVVSTGPWATVQDLGRPGYADIGVPRSGAADLSALRLANRLVGNEESAAGLECTFGGLAVRVARSALVAVTGPPTTVSVDGVPVGVDAAVHADAGAEIRIDAPRWGCRNYLGVRGGVDTARVLGSRSTDVLSGLGPDPLRPGDELGVADAAGAWPPVLSAPPDGAHPSLTTVETHRGPRADRVDIASLYRGVWEVSPDSNRVGVRLDRPEGSSDPVLTHRDASAELRSEGIAHGSVQVPPTGKPVLFLADHPVTGGYPVVAVLTATSTDLVAQLTPGSRVRFRAV